MTLIGFIEFVPTKVVPPSSYAAAGLITLI